MRRRRVPGLQVQERRLCPRALLRQGPGAEEARRPYVRRADLEPDARRPRSQQGLRGLCRRRGAQGPADRDPGEDRQGLRHGRGRRGPEHHPPAEEDGRGGPQGVPRPLQPAGHRRADQGSAVPQAGRGQPGDGLSAGTPGGTRRQPADAPAEVGSAGDPAALDLRGPVEGDRRARDFDHDGVRPRAQHAAARQADRQAGRADRAGRKPHLRHGRHVPPVRHLQPGRPALPAGRRQAVDVLPRGQERPDPSGRHQRAGRHVVVDRGGDIVQHQQHADDPVLRLLLDVRVPAGRRSGLGRRRHAGAGIPDRRHRRTDHAERRGFAARGRPQPHLLRR